MTLVQESMVACGWVAAAGAIVGIAVYAWPREGRLMRATLAFCCVAGVLYALLSLGIFLVHLAGAS